MFYTLGITFIFFLFFFLETDINSILKHYINSVFVVLNLLLTKKPYRILHFYIPVIFSVIYILFSLVYQKGFNQNAIYTALDWNIVPNVFLYVFGLPLVFVPLLTLLLYTITVFRDAIGNLCEKNIGQTDRPVAIDWIEDLRRKFKGCFMLSQYQNEKQNQSTCTCAILNLCYMYSCQDWTITELKTSL